MAEAKVHRSTVRSERLTLTDAERSAVDALDERDRAAAPDPWALQVVAELRHRLAAHTREAFAAAIPDLEARRGRLDAPPTEDLERLKGTAPLGAGRAVSHGDEPSLFGGAPSLGTPMIAGLVGSIGDLLGPGPVYVPPGQPAGAGELWWSETSAWVNDPTGALQVDIDHDPCRIWGHVGYGGDPLITGDVGVTMIFVLTPDRMPRTDRTRFEVRPEPRLGGWVSAWTGQYHPIWHADDKWAKVSRSLTVDLTTSTGQWLAGDALHVSLIHLENAEPVGQANVSEFMGWTPVLQFGADLAALRQQQTSIILRFSVRYDLQLEGESDLWFRHREGSASTSVAAFDNAVTVRMLRSGVVTPI